MRTYKGMKWKVGIAHTQFRKVIETRASNLTHTQITHTQLAESVSHTPSSLAESQADETERRGRGREILTGMAKQLCGAKYIHVLERYKTF